MGLYFFSGKGGVGKTHLATSFVFNRIKVGRKVLLIEFSQFAQYSEYFNMNIGFEPQSLKEGFRVCSWSGRDCLQEYVGRVLRSQKVADFFMQTSLMEKLIHVAPGLKEIAVLGKLTSDYRDISFSTDFDDIVFDAPSSGHFVSLLSVPESLSEIVGVGPMKKQCADILDCLQNSKDVFIGLVDDGSIFSDTENLETVDKIQKILIKKRITKIHNFSKHFPSIDVGNWIENAKELAPYWNEFQWV